MKKKASEILTLKIFLEVWKVNSRLHLQSTHYRFTLIFWRAKN